MHGHHEPHDDRRPVVRTRRSAIAVGALLLCAALLLLGRGDGRARRRAGDERVAASAPAGAAGDARRPVTVGFGGRVPGGTPAPRASFEVGAVMEQVHYAYRLKDGAWRGGHTTYEVALQPGGVLEVVPYHHPKGRPAGTLPAPGARRDPARLPQREPPAPEEVVEGAAVKFAAATAARGGEVIASGAGEAGPSGKGQLEIAKGAVIEQLKNGPDGVEQSWRFAERPAARGDLEVRVALAGGAFIGETASGLHFGGGKLAVRYGHATWIDALGVETAVPARWDGSAIVLRVPAAVLDGSVFPAALDPVISPELDLDQPVYGPAWNGQSYPAVAGDGAQWLVVWEDYRAANVSHIYGARVSGAGAVLDRAGIAISTGATNEYYPAVAWDGTDFLVVWSDGDLRGARVSGTGVVLDAPGFAISTAANGQSYPAIAWGGTEFLVTWQDGRNGNNDIYCARVTGAAAVLDPGGIAVSTAANAQVFPAVAWDGTDWLVVWYDYRTGTSSSDIYGARVQGSDGAVLDPSGIAISTAAGYQTDPAVAWDGTNYLVVWRDTRNSSSADDIYGARVSSAGAVLDPTGFAISTATNNQYDPAVAWDGTDYLVVWVDARNAGTAHVYGARVSSAGAVLDAAGFAVSLASTLPGRPAAASSGSDFLVVWDEYRSAYQDVYGVRVSATGAVLDAPDIAISVSANAEQNPAVAWDGTNYLVVWQDARSDSYGDIYGARLSGTDGTVLDGAGIAISTAAKSQASPAVAWDGTDYLVVWQDQRNGSGNGDIYGARVSGAGAVLDPAGIPISTSANDQGSPSVAWDGTNHLVVWDESRTGTYRDILGARVTPAGAVLDTPAIVISAAPNGQFAPAVAWNGTSHLVVWYDYRGTGTGADVYGARVSGAGAVLDPTGIAISTAADAQLYPAVAWDGTNHLVVWQDHRSGSSYDIYGARVAADGSVLDASGIAISAAAGDQISPAVAWDGTRYLVAWQDLRSGATSDIYAAQVTADGAALDADGFLVSGSPSGERLPAVASPGPLRFLVVYDTFDASPDLQATRIRARTVSFGATPVAYAQSVTTAEDTPIAVTLTASDPGGVPLTFSLVTSPAHGTLSGSGAGLTYTPAANYHGSDAFTFVASDGAVTSNEATVSITVSSVNDAPVAQAQSVTLDANTSVAVTLVATDVDGDALTYAVVTPPAHGALSGVGANLTYTPAAGYAGADAFTFKANDGTVDSAAATVAITVTPVAAVAAKGGCGCATTGDLAPLGALLVATLGLRRRRRG